MGDLYLPQFTNNRLKFEFSILEHTVVMPPLYRIWMSLTCCLSHNTINDKWQSCRIRVFDRYLLMHFDSSSLLFFLIKITIPALLHFHISYWRVSISPVRNHNSGMRHITVIFSQNTVTSVEQKPFSPPYL